LCHAAVIREITADNGRFPPDPVIRRRAEKGLVRAIRKSGEEQRRGEAAPSPRGFSTDPERIFLERTRCISVMFGRM
jgi:hypothetical protein